MLCKDATGLTFHSVSRKLIPILYVDLEPLPNMSQKKSTDTSLLSRQPDDTTDDDEFITADLNKKSTFWLTILIAFLC